MPIDRLWVEPLGVQDLDQIVQGGGAKIPDIDIPADCLKGSPEPGDAVHLILLLVAFEAASQGVSTAYRNECDRFGVPGMTFISQSAIG